ncbi:MAG: immunoglobulin domain-containing protein [Planctomycetes bacterium]|nr:immunoglobulin domain-containing protein [Planctomycetota bacterium]MBI3847251.1 immunoglobulin domain-containing protein [Planctomycetota bacterium]
MRRTPSVAATLLVAGLAAAPALAQVTINEIRIDQTGTDNDEYFELAGTPGASLNGMTYIVLGDGGGGNNCGVIETVVSLNGLSIPADGYFLCVESTFTLGIGNADLVAAGANPLNFENTDNVTHMLVTGFTGTLNQDIDADENGALDSTPWTAILDSVAVKAVATGGDCVYSTTIAGPDAGQTTNPGHAFRCPNGSGPWFVGPFDPASGLDTPGAANGVPTISTQPTSQSSCEGGSVTVTVVASGTGTLTYQWRKGGVDIGGATNSSLTISPVALGDAGSYDVVVTGCGSSITSTAATLTVGGSTSIVTQPASQTVFVGDPVTFSVLANGAPPITFQWRKGGVDIGGATSSSYSIASTVFGDAGSYDVVVTSGCGTATSDPAVLTVNPLPTVRLNEIRIDEPGTDNNEYFELSGTPGESMNGLTVVVIGDSGADNCGIVEVVVPLTGFSIPADGYFLAVEDTFTLAPLANADVVFPTATSPINFENTDNVTHLLVRGFTGAIGNDLDTNNDGTLDVTPWVGVLDSVAVLKGTAPPEDCTYSATTIGPDGVNAPGHVYRCPNGTGAWIVGPFDFTMGGRDTPGDANPGPILITQPASVNACIGSSVTFTVVAGGGGTITYQWRKNGVDIGGATLDTLTIDPVGAGDAADYDVVVSNGCASVASNVATLSLGGSTTIQTQPQSVHVFVGGTASFMVVATGAPPITYQWRKGGVDIGGATADTYTIPAVTLGDAGSYDVVVTSGCGATTSDSATLTVKTPPMVTINEIRTDEPGTDNNEYFELCGAAGTSLTGLTYVVIGDGSATNTGVVEAAIDLTGEAIPANGHFLCAEDTFAPGCGRTPDLVLTGGNPGQLNFENSDNVTHLLVTGFTGMVGQDLDPDDNCTLDTTPWSGVLDQVSLIGPDAPPTGDCTYAPTTVGPETNINGSFVPSHVFRCPDCTGGWRIGTFTTLCLADETPGFGNPPCILQQPANQSVCEGQSVTFVVVAIGAPPVTYQWRRNGTSLLGANSDTFTIPFVTVSNAGGYDVIVGDANGGSTISSVAILTVGALFDVRRGNVNAIIGPVTDVLFVNNAVGSIPDRRLVVSQNGPFQIRMASPPSRAHSPYALYAWRNEPTKLTRETLPMFIGDIAAHTPFSHTPPQPLKIANNTGHAIAGVENWPGPPTQSSPYVLLDLPNGLHRVGTFYLQGIIVDTNAPNGQAGVTNGIVVVSQ